MPADPWPGGTQTPAPVLAGATTSGLDAPDLNVAKDRVRAGVRRARAEQPFDARRDADAARTQLVVGELRQHDGGLPRCVACYLSVDPEPGTLALVEQLWRGGVEVLVPLLAGRRDPAFARYAGPDQLRAGLWGIPEPVDAVAVPLDRADVVLCSALAATPDGRRLGVGGGWYDRALQRRRPGVSVWALLNEREVMAELPTGQHDQPVQVLVTENRVIRCRR